MHSGSEHHFILYSFSFKLSFFESRANLYIIGYAVGNNRNPEVNLRCQRESLNHMIEERVRPGQALGVSTQSYIDMKMPDAPQTD
jgi:hypothetical protein